jgi:hypothetical protein
VRVAAAGDNTLTMNSCLTPLKLAEDTIHLRGLQSMKGATRPRAHPACLLPTLSLGTAMYSARFRQIVALEDATGYHACSLEALPCV